MNDFVKILIQISMQETIDVMSNYSVLRTAMRMCGKPYVDLGGTPLLLLFLYDDKSAKFPLIFYRV